MGKKLKAENRGREIPPGQKTKTVRNAPVTKESRAMVNWLMVFLAIFPFVFSRITMDPVLSIRYTFIGVFTFLFILYFFAIRKTGVSSNWPLLIKLAFVFGVGYGLWNFISLTEAVNKQQAYYGLARHFLNMIMLFMFTSIAEKEENHLIQVCKLLAIVGIIHFIVGMGQFYEAGFMNIPGNFIPYGLMANRNLFGSAQVMLLPFVIYVLYKSSLPWKIIASISLIGITASSIMSQTRSSWIAAIAMLMVSLVLVLVFSPANRKKWIIGTASGLAISLLFGFLLISSDPRDELATSIRERTTNMFATDTANNSSSAAGNVSERLKIWNKTMEVIKANPITGVGQGNWKIVVAKYGSEGLAWAEGKYIPDSPHNDYLLVAAESGIPGALLYFGMWLLIGITGLKTIIRSQNTDRRIFSILLVSGLVGYALDCMFSFPMERMEHSVYLFLIGGILLGLYLNETRHEKVKRSLPVWVSVVILLIAAFNIFLGLKKINFEKYLNRSKSLEEQKNYSQSVIEGKKGQNAFVSIGPNGFPIEAYIGLSQKGLKNTEEALKEMNKAIQYHPYNKALYVNKGTVYTDLAKYDTAIKYYNMGLALTPRMPVIYYNLAVNYFNLKDYKKTVEILNRVDISKEPNLMAIKQQAEAMLPK